MLRDDITDIIRIMKEEGVDHVQMNNVEKEWDSTEGDHRFGKAISERLPCRQADQRRSDRHEQKM